MQVPVTTYYLEMRSRNDLRPRRLLRDDLHLVLVQPALPELNRFFYTAVGGDWYWIDRLPWSYQQWRDYLQRPDLETWMMTAAGVPVGYCELERQADNGVELVYFGVLPGFIGQGFGGHLLTVMVERAWEWD